MENPRKINSEGSDPGQFLAGAISSLSWGRNAALLVDLTLLKCFSSVTARRIRALGGVCTTQDA